jgi:TetR/AcrR family transcriptional regulator, lmrAB and yxaGH operons repressor
MRKGAQTRQHMLDAAMGLFQRQGYHATGLNQVLAEADAPKGSLYFHFPGGKQQLAAEAVTSAGTHICDLIEEILKRADGPREAMEEIVDLFGRMLEGSDFQRGCPVATVALEASDENAVVRGACDEAYRSWLAVLKTHMMRWGVSEDRVDDLVIATLSALEGALLLSRVQRDIHPLRVVGDQVVASLIAAGSNADAMKSGGA